MIGLNNNRIAIFRHLLVLALIIGFAAWLRFGETRSSWQAAGKVDFILGFVLIAAFCGGQIMRFIGLPRISGYIFAGILSGPFVSGLLTNEMVSELRLIDDLALSFIALSAGGALKLNSLKNQASTIVLNIVLQVLTAFGLVFLFLFYLSGTFDFTRQLPASLLIIFAMLIGVISVARSPSSAMAVITECKASGPFTETILGVTVVIDVLIIIFFTMAMSVGKLFLLEPDSAAGGMFGALGLEIAGSIAIGLLLGWCISFYIGREGPDLTLFLVFLAFGVTKLSLWIESAMDTHFALHMSLEPLLICMAAGFFVQNYSSRGSDFEESLERVALPIYVFFFSVAGASLNLQALLLCWPIAAGLVVVRAVAIFFSSWLAGTITRMPAVHNRSAWMAYLTQAGVAIGLGQLAERQFPELNGYLTTVVLAIITINQIIGPITFKMALQIVCESRQDG